MGNNHNREIYELVDGLLAQAGFQPDCSIRNHLGCLDFNVGAAEIAALKHDIERKKDATTALATLLAAADDVLLYFRSGNIIQVDRAVIMSDSPAIQQLRAARALATAVVEAERDTAIPASERNQ